MTLKDSILKALEKGTNAKQIAKTLGTSTAYVYATKTKNEKTKTIAETPIEANYVKPRTQGIDIDLPNNKVTMTVAQFEYFLSLWKIAA